MIKRPLVWILGAYLAGMYLAWQKYSIIIVIIVMLLILVLNWIFMYKAELSFLNRSDRFLWSLPFLLSLGFYSMGGQMKLPPLYDAFDQEISCELSGSITMIVEKQWGQALYVKNIVVSFATGDQYQCENVIVNCSDHQNYLVGNQIRVQGTLQKFSEAVNPGQFNEQLYYQIENIDFKMKAKKICITDPSYSRYHRVIGRLKSKLIQVYSTILSEDESGTLIAMLLGEKYLLNEEIKQLYQENGISHLLAISGLHISLIGMCIYQLLKKLRLPITLVTFVSIFFIYTYGVLTNFSVSTNRAVVMMVIMLLAVLIGKTYDMLSASALSAFLILLQNPLQIMSAGFLLSFGAVLGIAVVLPCLHQLFSSKRNQKANSSDVKKQQANSFTMNKNAILDGLFISLSAQIVTTPFLLQFFYQFPSYSILTNLLVLPFVTMLTLTSLLAGIAGIICLPLGIFLIGGANYILKLYEWICRVGSNLPGNMITVGKPDSLRVLLYFSLIALFLYLTKKYEKKALILLLAAAFVILIVPQRNVGLEITVLDVGQGDAIFMESERGTTYLVDGGSSDVSKVGTYRLQPFLKSQGVSTLDYAMITHSDYDHISGLTELIAEELIEIKHLILPDISEKDEAYLELEELARENEIPIQYIKAGERILEGGLSIFCLHPCDDYVPESSNAYSTVLSINYGEFDLLLTGDLEGDGEQLVTELLQKETGWQKDTYGINQNHATASSKIPAVNYDILKVAHHGSRNSTGMAFLELIRPEISLISCGKDNSYGHPHAELLDRLTQIGSDVKITYESGAITIKTDGKKMEVSEYRKD